MAKRRSDDRISGLHEDACQGMPIQGTLPQAWVRIGAAQGCADRETMVRAVMQTYCLHEAKDPPQLLEQANVFGVPADVVVELSRFWPDATTTGST